MSQVIMKKTNLVLVLIYEEVLCEIQATVPTNNLLIGYQKISLENSMACGLTQIQNVLNNSYN